MAATHRTIEEAFRLIEQAAIKGERCPINKSPEVNGGQLQSGAVSALCKEGRILVEISGRNWRQATILVGKHAGKKTAPNPKGERVYKTVGTQTALATAAPKRVTERREPIPRWLREGKF